MTSTLKEKQFQFCKNVLERTQHKKQNIPLKTVPEISLKIMAYHHKESHATFSSTGSQVAKKSSTFNGKPLIMKWYTPKLPPPAQTPVSAATPQPASPVAPPPHHSAPSTLPPPSVDTSTKLTMNVSSKQVGEKHWAPVKYIVFSYTNYYRKVIMKYYVTILSLVLLAVLF